MKKQLPNLPQLPSFESFQEDFLAKLGSKDFGADPYSTPGAKSPAAKELERTGAGRVFSRRLLNSVYKLLLEHSRLVDEQPWVRGITEKHRTKIRKLTNALMTIRAVARKLRNVDENTKGLVNAEVWSRVRDAISDCEQEVRRIRTSWVSRVYPADRTFQWSTVPREPILRDYDYELPTLKKKAPDQWLYEALNELLASKLARFEVSDITRYRIMSALVLSCGLDRKPITFTQHFRARAAAKAAAKKAATKAALEESSKSPVKKT